MSKSPTLKLEQVFAPEMLIDQMYIFVILVVLSLGRTIPPCDNLMQAHVNQRGAKMSAAGKYTNVFDVVR